MRVDQNYLKDLPAVLLASERYVTELPEFRETGFDFFSDAFLFHFPILKDQEFV